MIKVAGSVLAAALCSPLMAATVPVRFAEGLTRGHLVLRDLDNKLIAHGDLLQTVEGDDIHKRMVFHFLDGSLYDERVIFTEKDAFRLKSYKLTERGPAFEADAETMISPGDGRYSRKVKKHKDGEEKTHEGTIEIPADTYNGMIITIVKDFDHTKGGTVHFVVFAPDAKVIELQMIPEGEHDITVGDLKQKATHYRIHPQLGFWTKLFAKVLNKVPPDLHAWVAVDDVPAFVGFEGPITSDGPVWRIEVVSPKLAR